MKVAINGFGRIGRLVFRIMEESDDFEVVAINDLTNAKQLAHLLKYDSSQGRYRVDEITYRDDYLIVGKREIRVYAESDPSSLPWGKLGIDMVLSVVVSLLLRRALICILRRALKGLLCLHLVRVMLRLLCMV